MTPTEMVMLTRYIKALCPQQQIDEYTADAWHDVLGHLDLADARHAAVAVARRQPFIAPSEIIGEVAGRLALGEPHSIACRGRDCRDCRVSWCRCTCHPPGCARAIAPPSRPVLPRSDDDREPRKLSRDEIRENPRQPANGALIAHRKLR